MKRTVITAVLAIAALGIWSHVRSAEGCGDSHELLGVMANKAVSEDPHVAQRAIQFLREQGPEGLQALLSTYADTIKLHLTTPPFVITAKGPEATEDRAWQRLRAALDEVSGQRDCHVSHLYWYTDFDQAKAAAKREGKPILSLRLLGKLTDEYSCANSRFFRTTLYSNAEISKALQDHFILHWKSVRPVPKVTIDFGDGRKLERTLTGNSIHYILDSDGQVIDALPGLYGPKAFLREIDRAEETVKRATGMSPSERESFLAGYHRDRAAAIEAAWQQDLDTLGIDLAASDESPTPAAAVSPAYSTSPTAPQQQLHGEHAGRATDDAKTPPTAAAAGAVARSKWSVEQTIVEETFHRSAATLTQATSEAVWNRIAQLHADDSKLDAASFNLIRSQHPTAAVAARMAVSKMAVEDPLVRMVRTFQGSIALDTVRNEYLLHRHIHHWLAAGRVPEIDALNERVYAELFLTPSTDPWLGLMPADTYTALEDNGVAQAPSGK